MSDQKFSIPDYAVFFAMLVVSALIGFYYAWKDKGVKTVNQVLLGGGDLQIFPVAMSIVASFTSAVSVLGFSMEMYKYGSMYLIIGLSYFFTQPFAAQVYVPFFHRLKITSAYEYLERRFNYYTRLSASIVFCFQMFLYMAVVLYSPSLAVQQVTGIPLWISIFLTGFICTIYTSLGGMKAVVFTDTFQVFVMFAGLFAIIIKGSIDVGGLDIVWQRMSDADRIDFFDFDPNPFVRHTFWALFIGGFFTSLTIYGSNQATIQRYLTIKSVRDAKISIYINLIGTFLILVTCCICGFVAYAYYYTCDPLAEGKITKHDQILPYFVVQLLGNYYGLPGLFIACVYSGALSTVSSGLNSLTAVFLHDFIYPFHRYYKKSELSEKYSMNLTKILSAIFGLITIGLAFLCEYAGNTVLQLSLSIFGIMGGPLLGLISIGMFVPFANAYGALAGFFTSLIINIWLSLGSIIKGLSPIAKPFRTDGCVKSSNSTTPSSLYNDLIRTSNIKPSKPFDIYELSYMWYSLLALIIVFLIGIIISLITNRYISKKELDPNLLFSFKRDFSFSCSRSNKNKIHNGDIENNNLNSKSKIINANDEIDFNKTADGISNEVL